MKKDAAYFSSIKSDALGRSNFHFNLNKVIEFALKKGFFSSNLDSEKMLYDTCKKTGFFIPANDKYLEGFHVLIQALKEDNNLSSFGKWFWRQGITRALNKQLVFRRTLHRNPEILKVKVESPVFIIGLPRTGTTFLHQLMSAEPSNRAILSSEMIFVPEKQSNWNGSPSFRKWLGTSFMLRMLYNFSPKLASMHWVEANSPEECDQIILGSFCSYYFEMLGGVPRYAKWLSNQDFLDAYTYHKQYLQLLQWYRPGKRFLLKAPFHLFNLPSIMSTYPDAKLIFTYRDPINVVPSWCSLATVLQGLTHDSVDLCALGSHWSEKFAKGFEQMIVERKSIPENQVFDVDYRKSTKEPIDLVSKIYSHFGFELNEFGISSLKNHIANNPQHKHGVHTYSLEQFGLSSEGIKNQYSSYYKFFNLQ